VGFVRQRPADFVTRKWSGTSPVRETPAAGMACLKIPLSLPVGASQFSPGGKVTYLPDEPN
jgi:hypothetical protein